MSRTCIRPLYDYSIWSPVLGVSSALLYALQYFYHRPAGFTITIYGYDFLTRENISAYSCCENIFQPAKMYFYVFVGNPEQLSSAFHLAPELA